MTKPIWIFEGVRILDLTQWLAGQQAPRLNHGREATARSRSRRWTIRATSIPAVSSMPMAAISSASSILNSTR